MELEIIMISTNLELSLKHCNLALGDTIFEAEVNQDTVVGVGTTYITYDIHNFTDRMHIDTPTSREHRQGFSFNNQWEKTLNGWRMFPDISQTGIGTTSLGTDQSHKVMSVGSDTVATVLENVTKAMLLAVLDGTSKRTTTVGVGTTEAKKKIFFNAIGMATHRDFSMKPWGGSDAFISTHSSITSINSISRTSGIASIKTSSAHGLSTSFDDWGAIVNINTSSFNISTTTYPNGVPIVITGSDTFTYRNAGINTTISSGITGNIDIKVGWGGTSNNLHIAIL